MTEPKLGARAAARAALMVLSVATWMLGAEPANAGDACISAEAEKAMASCPAGTTPVSVSSVKSAPDVKPPPPPSKPSKDDRKPGDPPPTSAPPLRPPGAARARPLLVTAIQGLESLFESTKKTSPDRPGIARRLAESYVELETESIHDATLAEIARDQAKKAGDTKLAEAKQDEAKKANDVATAARKGAIKYYTVLKDDHPNFCMQNGSGSATLSGCGDEVLYYLAYEYEMAKDQPAARKAYLQLIQDWPNSKYIPNAYFAFGELFYQEAQSDPAKWSFAQQSYEEVIKYPAPDNRFFGAAHYKLGYVHWNTGDYAKAMTAFKNVIDYSTNFSQLPDAASLGTNARRDLIPIYALSGDPKKAYGFFQPLAGNVAGSSDKTYAMMDDLGLDYLDTGHYQEAIDLYHDLMQRDRGEKTCDYQGHVTVATLALSTGDKDVAMKELQKQLAAYKDFKAGKAGDAAKTRCGNVTVELEFETAMSWHLEAVGTSVRGTNDPKTMKYAADLYEGITANFTKSDFASYKFPRFVEADWPTLTKIKYWSADLLYFAKDWKRCAPAFDAVVAEDPKGPDAAEASFTAALCYQAIYDAEHKNGSDHVGNGELPREIGSTGATAAAIDAQKFAPKPLGDSQKAMIGAFDRYACYIQPDDKASKEARTRYAEMKFARARVYFDAKHWEEAAAGFHDVALAFPDEEPGVYAAQLYLESVNVLASHSDPARPACFDLLGAEVPKLVETYCTGARKEQMADQCTTFNRVQRDVQWMVGIDQMNRGNAHLGTPESIEEFRQAGQTFLDMWEKYGKAPCEKGDKDGCSKNDQVLANAASAFQSARLVMKAVNVRKTLIDPKYHLADTDLARKAVYQIGANYQAIAVYDEASKWYERFASENPRMEEKDFSAATALKDATVLRLGLGQEEQAIKDADEFASNYGAKKPAEAAQIAFAIGAHDVDKEDWNEARKRLSGALGQIDRNANLDVQIQAHALMGRVYAQLGSNSSAKIEYEKVRAAWKNPDDTMKRLNALGDKDETDDAKLRRVGKVLTAVGESLYFFAEEKRANVDGIVFPAYKGSGERADVLAFVDSKVADWVKRKQKAIDDAEAAYLEVAHLQPPPPRWLIASGSRVGQMKGKFVAEFRAAPIPKEWLQDGPSNVPGVDWSEIRAAYFEALDKASEPIKLQAKSAYETCLKTSTDNQYFDENSRVCERWLSKTYPADYHLIDEFRTSPNRVGSGLEERAQVLNADRTPVVDAPKAAAPKESATKPDTKAPGKKL